MNERIKELSEQARYAIEQEGILLELVLEEFAELIIKECAGLVQGVPIDTMGYQSADQKIKQHFGVEE